MGFDNVVAGHGAGIALLGLSVVFAGLLLVSAFIASLPHAFRWFGVLSQWNARRRTGVAPRTEGGVSDLDAELLAAICCVVHAEHERELLFDRQRITLRDDVEEQRVWTAIGKMRTLATRM
jgi:hypothetical protein